MGQIPDDVPYRELLGRAIRRTNYSLYLGLTWTMLFVLSAVGSYRTSLHPKEPAALVVFCYVLIAVWLGMIVVTVRERLRAKRMVAKHLAALAAARQASTPAAAAASLVNSAGDTSRHLDRSRVAQGVRPPRLDW